MFTDKVPFVDGAKYDFFPGIEPYTDAAGIKISDLDSIQFLTLKSLDDFIPSSDPRRVIWLKVIKLMLDIKIVESIEFSPTQGLWDIKFIDENPPSYCNEFEAVTIFFCGFASGYKIGFNLAYEKELKDDYYS